MFADEEKRLIAFTRVLAASVLCCLAFSWKLWISRPFYPLVPVFDWIAAFPNPFDYVFLCFFIGLLVGVVIQPRSKLWISLAAVAFGLFFLQDQNRLWPSFYQFFVLFLLRLSYRSANGKSDARRVLTGMRFVIAAIYFWGGVQKLNTHFFHEEFPWFVQPVTELLPFDVPYLPAIGVFAALFEVLFGIGLLTKRFRNFALYDAMLMHLVIFFCIGPFRDNWNNSSWIWGQTVAIQAWILFFRAPAFDYKTLFDLPGFHNVPQAFAVLLIGILPVLNNFNRWDSALSFNVYTGNVNYAEIRIDPDVVDQLPGELRTLVNAGSDRALLDLNKWALHEFNANAYPENRIFKAVFRKVCSYLPSNSASLYVREKSGWFVPRITRCYNCELSELP